MTDSMDETVQGSPATKAEMLSNEEARGACGSVVDKKQTCSEIKDDTQQGCQVKDACECNHVTEKNSKDFRYTFQQKEQVKNEGEQYDAVSGAQQQNKEEKVKDIPCQDEKVSEDFQGHHAATKEGHCIEEDENQSCNSMENIEKGSDAITHEYTCSEVTNEEEVKDKLHEDEVNDIRPQNEVNDIPQQNDVNDIPPQNGASDIPPQNEVNDKPPQNEVIDIPQQNGVKDNDTNEQHYVKDTCNSTSPGNKVITAQENEVNNTTQQNDLAISAAEQREDIPKTGISKGNDDVEGEVKEMEEMKPTNSTGRVRSKVKDMVQEDNNPGILEEISQLIDSTQCCGEVSNLASSLQEKTKSEQLSMDNSWLRRDRSTQTKPELFIFTGHHKKSGRKLKSAQCDDEVNNAVSNISDIHVPEIGKFGMEYDMAKGAESGQRDKQKKSRRKLKTSHETEMRHHNEKAEPELSGPDSRCEEHGEMVKYYCKMCRLTKCTDCIVLSETCRSHMDMVTKLHTHICTEKVNNTKHLKKSSSVL